MTKIRKYNLTAAIFGVFLGIILVGAAIFDKHSVRIESRIIYFALGSLCLYIDGKDLHKLLTKKENSDVID